MAMEFVSKVKTKKETTKTAKEVKAEEELDRQYKKVLYGAGQYGWTAQWYKRIMDGYKANTLTIGDIRPYNKNEMKPLKPFPKYYTEINILLAEEKKEEELTDAERTLLMAFCHPKRL